MAIAHLIHGFLGAGKTTFARQLEAQRPAVRYSPDEWMVALFGDDPPHEQFAGCLERVQGIVDEHWPRVLACGTDVVLDFGFWTRAWRDAARARAHAVGASTRIYWLQCDPAVARARCLARNQDLQGSLYIAPETYDLLRDRFEPLGADEPVFQVIRTG